MEYLKRLTIALADLKQDLELQLSQPALLRCRAEMVEASVAELLNQSLKVRYTTDQWKGENINEWSAYTHKLKAWIRAMPLTPPLPPQQTTEPLVDTQEDTQEQAPITLVRENQRRATSKSHSHSTTIDVDDSNVKVITPIANHQGLSHLRVQAIAQLILGQQVLLEPHFTDYIDDVELRRLRSWKFTPQVPKENDPKSFVSFELLSPHSAELQHSIPNESIPLFTFITVMDDQVWEESFMNDELPHLRVQATAQLILGHELQLEASPSDWSTNTLRGTKGRFWKFSTPTQ